MKRTVMKIVMAAVGVASLALAPSAFASDRGHRIPLPHEVLGIPAPHEVLLGVLSSNRGYDNYQGNYYYQDNGRYNDRNYRYERPRHHRHHRNEWRSERHHDRYDRHDRRHDSRDDRGRGGRRHH